MPKQAQELIEWNKPLTTDLHRLKINDMMKDLLAGKTAYCLRHTFATICQQYVRPDIVDIWMGDSPQRLVGKVYTHFSDDFMKKQMDLVIFPKFFPKRCRNRKNECIIIHLYNIKLAFMQ